MMPSPDAPNDVFSRLHRYLLAMQEGELTREEHDAFEALICSDPAACDLYISYTAATAALRAWSGDATLESEEDLRIASAFSATTASRSASPSTGAVHEVGNASLPPDLTSPLILDDTFQSPFGATSGLFSSGWAVAYLLATVIFGIAIAIGAIVHVSQPTHLCTPSPSPTASAPDHESRMQLVGRITAMSGCQWSDPKTETTPGAHVPLGRKYALSSGLMEITYDSGAKVLLQGPVIYEVESPTGGYLSLGRLTAKLEKKSEVGDQRSEPENHQSSIINEKSPDLCPLTSDLFAIRTPTVVVTDLGTEFGVEVDASGGTTSHVFRGSVQVQVAAGHGNTEPPAQVLNANESIRVEAARDRTPALKQIEISADHFTRQMPRRVPVHVHSTGAGLAEGDPDPHWQIIGVSNDPNFRPRPATVSCIFPREWLPNEPSRSQWISAVGDASDLPNGVTYTFRTSFDLKDMRPETAILRGWFLADNFISAIRLNGHDAPVPRNDRPNYHDRLQPHSITKGFVEGLNTLEIDVHNGMPGINNGMSAMGLRAELQVVAEEKR